MLQRLQLLVLLGLIPLMLSACIGSMISKQTQPEIKEQLYVDARLNFAIKHPLSWKLQELPVSSPQYRSDTVRWKIEDPTMQHREAGEMLIRSTPAAAKTTLAELLESYLREFPAPTMGKEKSFIHRVGNALKSLGQDKNRGRLTIAIKGQEQNFIISLETPASRFDELLPVFKDIVDNFVEIVPPKT